MPLVQPLPLSWLVHTIEYRERQARRSPTGNILYNDPITISRVRYDESTAYSRTPQENTLNYTGVIFVDMINSVGTPSTFVENSIIMFKGKELTIKRVITCYHPEEDVIRHFELEVI